MQVADLFASLRLNANESSFAHGNQLISGIKTALGGIAAFFAAREIEEGIKSVVDLGSSLNDTAQKTGIAVEGLQELGYVAKLNSSDMESVASGVKKLSRGLDEAAQKGTGPAAGALTRLGLSMQDATFKALPLDAKVQTIAEKLAKLPDGTEKTALSMDLFGRSGADLIPTLNDLGANGDKLRKEFRDMGGEISGKTAGALDDLGDNLDRAKFQFAALKTQIVVALLPTLSSAVTSLLGWVKANKEVIANGIGTVVDGLVAGFRALGAVIDTVTKLFKDAWAGDDGAQAILIGIGATISTIVVPALWAMAAPIVMASLPLIAIVGVTSLIALGVLKIIKHWDTVKNVLHSVGSWFVNIGHGIVNAFDTAWEAVKSAARAAFEWIINLPVVKQLIGLYNYFTRARTPQEQAVIDNAGTQAAQGFQNFGGVFGGYNSPANSVSPPAGAARQTGDVNATATINVTSNSADPKAVADEVGKQWTARWHGILRDAHAASGGADQ